MRFRVRGVMRSDDAARRSFHAAKKKIPFVSDEVGRVAPPSSMTDTLLPQGALVQPDKINGIKLEMFIFDVFSFAANMTAFAVRALVPSLPTRPAGPT